MNPRTVRLGLTVATAGLGFVLLSAVPGPVAHADERREVERRAAAGPEPVWVKTGGPLGGIGYDIRSRPDNPDVMLVTDNARGVHVSVDNGTTWHESNTGIDVRTGDGYPVFSLTVDPHDNDVVWAGTQSRMGIFKSTDGGRTWVRKSSGVAGDRGVSFRGFTVDPGDSNVVYAAGELGSLAWNNGVPVSGREFDLTRGVVYRTTDGGESWTRIWYGDNLARYVWIDPRNRDVLYVSTGIFDREAANSNAAANVAGGVGILKSTDGGRTWRALDQSNGLGNLYVGSLFMHPTNPDVLLAATGNNQYSTGAGVYLSTDAGETWTRTASEGPTAFGAVEISTASPEVCYAVAGSVYRSDDGCRTWTRYFTDYNQPGQPSSGTYWGPPGVRAGFPIDLEADRRDPMRVFANMYAGGNFVSTDGGRTWANASRGYTAAGMSSVAVDPTDPAVVYAVARSGVFRSTDGGGDWQGVNWHPATMSEKSTVAVSPSNPREVLLSDTFYGKLMKSVDGARSWQLVVDLIGDLSTIPVAEMTRRRQGFASIAFAPSNGRIVYAGMSIANCGDQAACALPTLKTVHRSADGGTTWQTTAGQGLGPESVLALAVHPANPDTVYAGTGAPGLFKSENGGGSWVSAQRGLPPVYVWALAIDPSSPNTLYAGTGGAGVFKSTDGGASWLSSSAGQIPNAAVRALALDPTNPSVVWAAGQGIGVYRSANAGATWVQVNTGLSTREVRAMTISGDGGTVYVGTFGEGVFRLDVRSAPEVRPHPGDANGDFRLSIGEVTAYGAAWKNGTAWAVEPNPIPIEHVTRAAYLWSQGETYRYDAAAGACPACWIPGAALPRAAARPRAEGTATRTLPAPSTAGVPMPVAVEGTRPDDVRGWAAEGDAPVRRRP